MNNVTGKVVLITGASSGIGEACANRLSDHGAIVILLARRTDKLSIICKNIQEKGQISDYYQLDVTDIECFQTIVQKIILNYGRIDILINNAGTMLLSQINEGKIDEWNQMIDINIKGVLNGINSVLPVMKKQNSGLIINIASTAAYRVMENSAVYSATKYGIRALTEGLRKEESNQGIKACLIAPGPTKTELLEHISVDSIKSNLTTYTEKYGLEPLDIADAVLYVSSLEKRLSIDELIISPTFKMNKDKKTCQT